MLKNIEFCAKKEHLRKVLIHYFILKKSTPENSILREVYGEQLLLLKILVNAGSNTLKVVILM